MESHPTTVRPRPWTGVVLVGVVIVCLAAASPPDAAAFHKLTILPRLTHLGLEGPGVSNDLVMSLTRFPILTQVHLANAPVSDVALLPFLNVAAPPRFFSRRTKLTLPMVQRVSQAGEDRAAEQGISQ